MEWDAEESLPSEGSRNWMELPPDVTAAILQRIGVIDILNNAQRVCTSWRTICRDPSMWRSIELKLDSDWDSPFDAEKMAMHAVDRSCGQLVDVTVAYFATDDFIRYLAQSSTQLRRLQIIYCHRLSDDVFRETASKFPMLEELKVQSTPFSVAAVDGIGSFCRQLKIFKCNIRGHVPLQAQDDDLANIISQAMPHLRHLQLLGTKITNTGLKAILNGCPCLETLDMRGCYLVEPKIENVGAVCSARYTKVRFPAEPIEPDELERDEFDIHSYSDDDDSFIDYFPDFASDFDFLPGHFDAPSDFDDLFYDDDDGVDYDDIFDNEEGEEIDDEEEEQGEELKLEEEEEELRMEEEELELEEKEEEMRMEELAFKEEEEEMRMEELALEEEEEEMRMEEEEELESELEEDEEREEDQ